MPHQNHHRARTTICCTCNCFICSAIAEDDEVVAVEDFVDVGNSLAKSWVTLCQKLCNAGPRGLSEIFLTAMSDDIFE